MYCCTETMTATFMECQDGHKVAFQKFNLEKFTVINWYRLVAYLLIYFILCDVVRELYEYKIANISLCIRL